MKRLLTLTAALLALLLVLSLSACGGDTQTEETTSAEAGETTETTEIAETTAPDLVALRDQMVADCGIADALNVETDALANLYGIDTTQVAASASFTAASGAAFPQEIVMVQAVDETAAAAIAENLTNRLTAIGEQAASYDPASLELSENCPVVTSGSYVGLFFSEHYDEMAAAFQSALGQ